MQLSGIEFDLRKDADIVLRKALPFALSSVAAAVLPGDRSRWGGVTVPTERFRWAPFYEFALLRGLKAVVEPGDTVVIVGGGLGVSSVVAARAAGPAGTVVTYEGDAKRAARCRDTVAANDAGERCDVRHAVVGTPATVDGDTGSAERVLPGDLPACDVLELDCEGAERRILSELDGHPRAVVVEYHESRGVTERDVRTLLDERGYTVRAKGAEHRTTGTYVLTATR